MPIYRGPGGAGDATNDATVTAVQAAAASAATSATNAANSATAAANSASGASTSATNAANSATSSAGSATSSANSATTSANYATNSSLSADDSAASALEAAGYASDAFDYSVAASVSSGTASDYADSAIAASASAYAHELAAASSASDAADSYADTLAIFGDATDVANAVAAAQLAESNASDSADAAAASAVTAAGSASSAAAQAVNAAASAATADAEATSAGASAVDAAEYAADASGYADEAQGYAGDALDAYQRTLEVYNYLETVEAAVANSLANRDAAAASATAASNSASAAATSATASASSATAAATSAAQANAVSLGNEPVRHSVRPSLLLDFANSKTLDPRITFSRASTGTYYDGKTTVKAEENLLLRSQEFDNASWNVNAAAIIRTANTAVAPDGTTTADSWFGDGTTNVHYSGQVFTFSSSATYAFSIYVKASGVNYIQLLLGSGNGYANFDVTAGAGVVGTSLAPFDSLAIQDVGSGWYRCSCMITNNSSPNIYVALSNSATAIRAAVSFATSDGVYLWGAQLEQRSSVTAYTATTTAPITNYIPALQTAASGVARFEHNPVTGESLGLEIEEQRTNLFLYSEFQAGVSGVGVIASSTMFGADGNNVTAAAFGTDGTTTSYLYKATTSASTLYTFSAYVKMDDGGAPSFGSSSAANVANDFVFNIGSAIAPPLSYVVTHVGDNLYRVCGSVTSSATPSSAVGIVKYGSNSARTFKTTGWQLEAGAFATSYIPTVASQVTRSADSASMTGTNFSSWYRADEGTFYGEAYPNRTDNGLYYSILGTYNAASNIRRSSGVWLTFDNSTTDYLDGQFSVTDSAGSVTVCEAGSASDVANIKVAGAWDLSSISICGDGASVVSASLTYPINGSADTMVIGNTYDTVYQTSRLTNGTIKKIAYYPKKLTSAELQGLTTV